MTLFDPTETFLLLTGADVFKNPGRLNLMLSGNPNRCYGTATAPCGHCETDETSHTSESPSHSFIHQTDSLGCNMERRLPEDSETGEQKANMYPTLRESHVALTTWENLGRWGRWGRWGRVVGWGACAFRGDLNDNAAVAMFAANNNTIRLLENTSNKSDSTHTHTYILIINTV